MRAINAVRELNEERDEPIRIIALHTDEERHALFVRGPGMQMAQEQFAAWTDRVHPHIPRRIAGR